MREISTIKKRQAAQARFFRWGSSVTLLLYVPASCWILIGTLPTSFCSDAPSKTAQRILTFPERVAHQRAIEEVYWRHRIWPTENTQPKPSLAAVMSQEQLENKVAIYLRDSRALEDYHQPITMEQLQS